jgi:Flp pilus assembly protein TadD
VNDQEHIAVQLLAYSYLQNARPEKAEVLLSALDAVAPGQRKVLRALALAQIRNGRAQSALDTLDRIALTGDTESAFHLLRARALVASGRRVEAGNAMRACFATRQVEAHEGVDA